MFPCSSPSTPRESPPFSPQRVHTAFPFPNNYCTTTTPATLRLPRLPSLITVPNAAAGSSAPLATSSSCNHSLNPHGPCTITRTQIRTTSQWIALMPPSPATTTTTTTATATPPRFASCCSSRPATNTPTATSPAATTQTQLAETPLLSGGPSLPYVQCNKRSHSDMTSLPPLHPHPHTSPENTPCCHGNHTPCVQSHTQPQQEQCSEEEDATNEQRRKRRRLCVITTTNIRRSIIYSSPTTYSTTTTVSTLSTTMATGEDGTFPTHLLSHIHPPHAHVPHQHHHHHAQRQHHPHLLPPNFEEALATLSNGIPPITLPPGIPASFLPPGFPFAASRRRMYDGEDDDEREEEEDDEDEDDDEDSDDEFADEYEVNDDDDYNEGEGLRRIDLDALNLPRFVYSKAAGIKEPLCVICQEEYQEGDVLLTLSCIHNFHAPCIEKWLSCKAECPLCKEEVLVAPRQASRSSTHYTPMHVH